MRISCVSPKQVRHPYKSINIAKWSVLCICFVCFGLRESVAATPPLPVISNQVFVVTNTLFAGGAYGDGISNSAAAINAAIAFANGQGGGTVEIPPVGVLTNYVSGPITMLSQVNLQIDSGAQLQMFPRTTWISNYGSSTTFINGSGLQDVEISGSGTIDGQGTNWWFPKASTRPNFINFSGCTRVLIQGVTMQNPPTFHMMLKGNNNGLTIQNIRIDTPFSSPNTDGMDLASTNVLIQGCYISDGDDNIEIGGSGGPATDVTITNCTFGTGHGVSIGSLTQGGVNNLIVSNCVWIGTEYGIKMKTDRDRGGLIENLKYCDMLMTNVNIPFAFYDYYNTIGSPAKSITNTPAGAAADALQSVTGTTPIFRNVTISNLTAFGNSGPQGPGNISGFIYGLPEMVISNVTLCKVNVLGRTTDGGFPIFNARAIQVIDSNLGMPNTGTNTLTLYNAEVTITNTLFNTNLVTAGGLAIPPTNNVLSLFNANGMIIETNLLGTGSITLSGSTLKFRQLLANASSNTISVIAASTLSFTNGNNLLSGNIAGSAPLTLDLPPNTTLTPQANLSSFFSTLIVSNSGTLLLNSPVTNTTPILVLNGAALAGTGSVAGPVTMDGTLAPGTSPGTLTISNNLILDASGTLRFDLGTTSDFTAVTGNLALGGTLNVSDAGGFTAGTYNLFSFGGALSGTLPTVGTVPDSSLLYSIDTNTAGLVKLVVTIPPPVADFGASVSNGIAPLTVTFTDNSTGQITTRFWDFGDGTTSNTSATTLQHTYVTGGNDNAQLIVTGPGGSGTSTVLIAVAPPCDFPLSTNSATFGVLGATNTVSVSPYTNACAWTASSNDSWIQISGGSVSTSGAAVVTYVVLPNITSSVSRIGTMTIAGQTFTVTEAGDPVAPTVSLDAPTSGILSNFVTLSATAADNVGVTHVDFYRDSGLLLVSVTSSPFTTNFNTALLSDGSHCLFAKAFDAANNNATSATNCLTVDNNAPSAPTGLTATSVSGSQINLSWSASVDPGTGVAGYRVFRDGSQIATPAGTSYSDTGLSGGVEHCYTVAASDNIGRVSALSASACAQTFTNLQAMVGSYNGLILATNTPTQATSGSITFLVGNAGSFTAKSILGGARLAFQGQFDVNGNATNAITRKGLAPLQVALHLDLAGSDQITGTVSDGSFTSSLLAERDAFSTANPCPFAGTFSVVFESPDGDPTEIPQGFGHGILSVSSTGRGRLRGILADGTKLSTLAPLSKHGTWPLYELLSKNQGAVIGWTTFTSNTAVNASANWFRPAQAKSAFYPAGFSTNLTMVGKRYTPPEPGSSVAGNFQVKIGDGNLPGDMIKNAYLYDAGNVVIVSENSENIKFTIDPATGEFSGSFLHPSLNKTVKFNGSVLQFGSAGAGYFLGTTESGFVILTPAP